jgi:YbgC/YbaW family acyl-CoA thioester hydrolase
MQRTDFRYFERLRVRWAEIDAQQIVFNGHYLMYFDTAIAGYWRALAMPYHETMTALGGDMFVRKATLEYLGSAVYDDVLDVGMRCARVGNSSILFQAGAFRQEQLLVSGELVYVFADPKVKQALPVPPPLRALFESFEAGEPMVEVRVGSWRELEAAARPIRNEVFIGEQKIPAEMEWDDADPDAVHAVAFNRMGRALGTGRMLEHVPGTAKIGRMAVAACAAGRGTVLRARRLRAPRTGVRRGGDRPRRDAARALASFRRAHDLERFGVAVAREERAQRKRSGSERGFDGRVDTAAGIAGRARRAREGLHPRLPVGLAADQEPRLQAGESLLERTLHRLDLGAQRVGIAIVDAVPDEELAHSPVLAQDATAASIGTG